jgi:hypothetical protein
MDYTALKNLIDADTSLSGRSDSDVADALNAPTQTALNSKFINKVNIYAALGFADGLALMATLKSLAASSDPATSLQFAEIIDLLKPESAGIDIGFAETRTVIDQLATSGVVTTDVATKIKALGEIQVGLAEATLGATVTAADVAMSRGNYIVIFTPDDN